VVQDVPIVPRPSKLNLNDVSFYVVTEETFEDFEKRFVDENGLFVFYALSVRDYEGLSLNIADLRRYLEQQKEIIIYYENSLQEDHQIDDI